MGTIDPAYITDFNNATISGSYTVSISFTAEAHAPFISPGIGYGLLEVFKAPGTLWIWQTFYPVNSSNTYIRNKTNEAAWTTWVLK